MELESDVAVNPRLRYRKSAVYVLKYLNAENVLNPDLLHAEMEMGGGHELWEQY
jgi:hypothetical protein